MDNVRDILCIAITDNRSLIMLTVIDNEQSALDTMYLS
jgi:hypothetical protein